MDKVLYIIIAATVFTGLSISLMAVSSGSIGDFGNSLNDEETSQICDIRVEQAQDDGDWSEIPEECATDDHIPEEDQEEVVESQVENDLT